MKKLKIFTICCMCMFCIILSGCNKNNQNEITSKIENSLNNISIVLKSTDNLANTDLVIKEIMDENEVLILTSIPNSNRQIVKYDNNKTGYNGATFTSANVYHGRYLNTDDNFQYTTLSGYVSKLEQLHDIASDTISANNNAKYLKTNIQSKVSALKTINSQIKNNEIYLNNEQCNAIEDLLTNLNANINKVSFSKNELINEVNSVKKLKNNYVNNIDQLNSKYTRLLNCLDTRCSYYSNCIGCLDGIYNCILNGNTSIDDLFNYYSNTENNSCEENNNLCEENCNNEITNNTNSNTEETSFKNYSYENLPTDYYNSYNGYNNNYWGYYYPRNINSFGGRRNINSYYHGNNKQNINTYNKTINNIDTFKNGKNYIEQHKDDINNKKDPYRVMPTNTNDKDTVQTNIQTNKDEVVNSKYELKEMFYGQNPYTQGQNKGFFRVYKVIDGKVVQDEIKEFDANNLNTENNSNIQTESNENTDIQKEIND